MVGGKPLRGHFYIHKVVCGLLPGVDSTAQALASNSLQQKNPPQHQTKQQQQITWHVCC